MKKLNELYEGCPSIDITGIKINSKEVVPGDIFVCTKGVTADRHDFIDSAIENGASAIVVSRDIEMDVPVIKVENTNLELPRLCSKFYDYPEEKLKMIGTTGTDGKTTVASIVQSLLGNDICGYIGTNGRSCAKFNRETGNTTPDSDKLYGYLDEFVKAGCKMVSMEASSEAFFRNRLDLIKFDVAILTNVTGDHLNIHKTFDNYLESKKTLFKQIKDDGVAIINIDDKYCNEFIGLYPNVLTYGKNQSANLCIENIVEGIFGTDIRFRYKDVLYEVHSPLLGEFNVYNLMAGILCLIHFGYSIDDIISRVSNIVVPNGRCEILDYGTNYKIVLDYAHTVNALKTILSYLNKVKKNRIITITGSAGGREKEKRKDMGKVVLENSDLVIFTTDDPRNENPLDIINEMIGNSSGNYEIIVDRESAIKFALDNAREDDIILIAGKGRDNYMAVGNNYIEYSDYEVVRKYFNK